MWPVSDSRLGEHRQLAVGTAPPTSARRPDGSPRRAVRDAAREHGVRYGSAKRLPFPMHPSKRSTAHTCSSISRGETRGGFSASAGVYSPRMASSGSLFPTFGPSLATTRRSRMQTDSSRGSCSPRSAAELSEHSGSPAIAGCTTVTHFARRSPRQAFVVRWFFQPGSTTIRRPGLLNLREREEESVYVEAKR